MSSENVPNNPSHDTAIPESVAKESGPKSIEQQVALEAIELANTLIERCVAYVMRGVESHPGCAKWISAWESVKPTISPEEYNNERIAIMYSNRIRDSLRVASDAAWQSGVPQMDGRERLYTQAIGEIAQGLSGRPTSLKGLRLTQSKIDRLDGLTPTRSVDLASVASRLRGEIG